MKITYSLCLIAASMVSACGASPKNVIVQDGPTVEQILRGEAGQVAESQRRNTGAGLAARLTATTSTGYAEYTRDSVNEIQQLFPTLPNPTIALYVHPHLVEDRVTREFLPVPGYTTAFPLYPRVQFALPGELPSSRGPVTTPFPVAHPYEKGAPFSDSNPTLR